MIFRVPGICTVSFGATATPVSLSTTKAGVIIRSSLIFRPVLADAGGSAPVDYIYGGRTISVDCVFLDPTVAAAGLSSIFPGGLGKKGGLAMGALYDESMLNQKLQIVEATGSATWVALNAIPMEPEFALQSTSEVNWPVSFLLVPDANHKLFSTLPAYFS